MYVAWSRVLGPLKHCFAAFHLSMAFCCHFHSFLACIGCLHLLSHCCDHLNLVGICHYRLMMACTFHLSLAFGLLEFGLDLRGIFVSLCSGYPCDSFCLHSFGNLVLISFQHLCHNRHFWLIFEMMLKHFLAFALDVRLLLPAICSWAERLSQTKLPLLW